MLALIVIGSLAIVPRADALRAAVRMCTTPVTPVVSTLPRTGALIVTSAPCERGASRLPVITSTFAGAPEALVDEVIAPGLHRRAPAGGFAPGVHTIEGVAPLPIGLTITDVEAPAPVSPSVRSIVRSARRVRVPTEEIGSRTRLARALRITVSLRTPVPDGVVAILVRWTGWTDDEGGVYGAWTEVEPGDRRFVLVCDAEDDCDGGHGHLPRADERFVARFVDVNGQLSEPSASGTVSGVAP